jgi:hypothetical protein
MAYGSCVADAKRFTPNDPWRCGIGSRAAHELAAELQHEPGL